jgi:hypothetical protein
LLERRVPKVELKASIVSVKLGNRMDRRLGAVLLLSFALSIAISVGDAQAQLPSNAPLTPLSTPPITKEQAVYLAQQKAPTVKVLRSDTSNSLYGLTVDLTSIDVSFYWEFRVYPKWLVTFNVLFETPIRGSTVGTITIQISGTTGLIEPITAKSSNGEYIEVDPASQPHYTSVPGDPDATIVPLPSIIHTLSPYASSNTSSKPLESPSSTPTPTDYPVSSEKLTPTPNLTNKAPAIAWEQQLIHGNGYSVYPISNGYVISAANETSTFLVKTDSSGKIVSAKNIQINGESTLLPYFTPTLDNGYAFAGVWKNQYAIVKTDSEGNILWTHQYISEAPISYFRSIIQTRDGGFAIAGFGEPVEEGEGWIWLAKTNNSGSLVWNKTLAGPLADCPSTIIELKNGDFMLSDVSYSIVPNQAFIRLIRISSDGAVLWNQTYGGVGFYAIPECNNAILTSDGGFLISGFLSGRNAWIVKTDAEGNMQWNQTYGGKNSALTCAKSVSNGYVIAGVLNGTQAWLIKTDLEGNLDWNMTFPSVTLPGALEANFNSIVQTLDGDIVIAGSKESSVWLLKLAYPKPTDSTTWLEIAIGAIVCVLLITTVLSLSHKNRGKPSN